MERDDMMRVMSRESEPGEPAGSPCPLVTLSPCHASPWRAWCYLVLLSWQRQARIRQMVWIALALLGFSVILIGLNTLAGRWGMGHRRGPRQPGQSWQEWRQLPTYQETAENL